MSTRRNLFLLLAGLTLLSASFACGLGVPQAAAPPAVEEPAGAEEPAPAQPTQIYEPGLSLATPTIAAPPIFLLAPPTNAPPPEDPQPAITESRRLTLEFPPVMRAGDTTRIRMQLEMDENGNLTPTAVVEGNLVVGETVQIPNLYETHDVIAEARLDMAGADVRPPSTISEPLLPGKSVTFYWSVHLAEAGSYQGTAWLHLRFIPKDGGAETRIPVSVQFIDMEATSFLGFSGGAARSVGTVGSAIGSVLGFPFLKDILKFILGKSKRKNVLREE